MRYDSHMLSSVTMGVALTTYTPINPSVALFAGILAGSLLPDIDEDQSYVGKRSMGTAKIIKGIFGHRGFTHSLLATFLVFLPYFFTENTVLLGIGFGYLFHILGDMLSKSGVPLFWFFTQKTTKLRIRIPLYVTGNPSESVVAFLFFVGLLLMLAPFFLSHWFIGSLIISVFLFYSMGRKLSSMHVPPFRFFFKNSFRRKMTLALCGGLLLLMTNPYLPLA